MNLARNGLIGAVLGVASLAVAAGRVRQAARAPAVVRGAGAHSVRKAPVVVVTPPRG